MQRMNKKLRFYQEVEGVLVKIFNLKCLKQKFQSFDKRFTQTVEFSSYRQRHFCFDLPACAKYQQNTGGKKVYL